MITPDKLFRKDVHRKIDTVIKADDQTNIFQEVDEYVVTREISNRLADFFVYFTLKVYRYFNVKVYHFNIKSKLVLSFLEVPPKRIKRALLFW